jgi:predicted AAA+ superfamily ATPase
VSESLTGRFELIRVPHWNYTDSRRGFKWDLETYLTYGGYPGSYAFVDDWQRWREYVHHSIIETVIGKDILGQRSVTNPALFRQAFSLLTQYPAQEISYTKLLGQLQDRGNTDLIKHYIELYEGAFLIRALAKYSVKPVLRKSSSPKILPLCPALCTVTEGPDVARSPEWRGRLFELAVGMELARLPGELFYWRENNAEVDYVYRFAGKTFAIEVKSGRKKKAGGLSVFIDRFPRAHPVLIDMENFLAFSKDPEKFFLIVSGVEM